MRRSSKGRQVMFAVIDGVLEQTVSFPDGHVYTQRCPQKSFESVAHVIEECSGGGAAEGVTMAIIAEQLDLPFTQANVALAFMKERGCVEVRHGRSYPASACLFEDAMMEFCYLDEVKD